MNKALLKEAYLLFCCYVGFGFVASLAFAYLYSASNDYTFSVWGNKWGEGPYEAALLILSLPGLFYNGVVQWGKLLSENEKHEVVEYVNLEDINSQ